MHRAAARPAAALLLLLASTLAPAALGAPPAPGVTPLATVAASSPGGLSVAASFLDMGGSWNCGRGTETVNLFANATGGAAPYTYVWDFGDQSPASDAANPVHTYAGVGPYTATVRVVDHAGGYGNATVAVTWAIPPGCSTTGAPPWGALLYAGLVAAVGIGGYLVVRWMRLRGG